MSICPRGRGRWLEKPWRENGTRLVRFDTGIRNNARKVLNATLYSYERGGASLLELLEARPTDADTQLEYVEALGGLAAASIRMEHAVRT